ncbi:hypothetical protein V1477_018347 [Vespula maculifrons]|uniref:Uncharacterized protein n=2 Tax=Vespula TaxID=7451 RepID=A0A834KTG4_VESVU|nr:hypothetical protein HZH66_001464 [Vespula vulgaris]
MVSIPCSRTSFSFWGYGFGSMVAHMEPAERICCDNAANDLPWASVILNCVLVIRKNCIKLRGQETPKSVLRKVAKSSPKRFGQAKSSDSSAPLLFCQPARPNELRIIAFVRVEKGWRGR